ncbi:hypothetical protein FQN53_007928 [Emmonsiellopsis sp. PD_33]|nr:hypothetical protein FQN53_007928 [Emmonsiellopsis sp. PD_33]
MAARDLHAGNNKENNIPLPPKPTPDDKLNRQLSRSPHPYHRRGSRTLPPASNPPLIESGESSTHYTPPWKPSPKTSSDSGTEADDESIGLLKVLPAPQNRSRPGGKGAGTAGDRSWAAFRRSRSNASRRDSSDPTDADEAGIRRRAVRRTRIEVLRRVSETVLVLFVAATVYFGNGVRGAAEDWDRELATFSITILVLYCIFPFRISSRGFRRRYSLKAIATLPFSTDFDPAPLIYPVLLPILVALSLVHGNQTLILPNIILCLSSIPPPVIPFSDFFHGCTITHWLVSIIPLLVTDVPPQSPVALRGVNPELLLLIFPLHQALVTTLHFLLTTSLLPTELQLLATGLINILLFARSPQAEILKSLLWLGGLGMFILCRHVLRWEVILARVPTWKFRRSPSGGSRPKRFFKTLDHNLCYRLSQIGQTGEVFSDSDDVPVRGFSTNKRRENQNTSWHGPDSSMDGLAEDQINPASTEDNVKPKKDVISPLTPAGEQVKPIHTLTIGDDDDDDAKTPIKTTPGGRRKRLITPNLQSFLSLTVAQAQVRKWLYAIYVYAATLFIILLPIRRYVSQNALHGNEPFGWAIGYLFGNIPSFRFWLVKANLESWIRIPPNRDSSDTTNSTCHLGRLEHLRTSTIGEATTRLLITGYCALVILTGLAIVLRLSGSVQVDTRRKVFHGMMVAMFLPTTFIDPPFAALALTLVLAIFLLLDLFRASQLPPISRPLTYFLAPYVDGRDHRGPVIVSHIFLLVGCAIPLWLSLAGMERVGSPPWEGWGVAGRDVSMVSGVVCVGMGDAAASLVGRRFGRRKWFWGGGKSIEGSVAFAGAVFVGLLVARGWLVVGGWERYGNGDGDGWMGIVGKSVVAAMGSSFMEAVLTGGNDNVVVPVGLWLVVRGLGI